MQSFSLFGCTTLSACLWAVFFFPETGGYAIEDIHQLWTGNIVKQSLSDNKYLFKVYNNAAGGAIGHEDIEHQTNAKGESDSTSKGSEDHIEKVRE